MIFDEIPTRKTFSENGLDSFGQAPLFFGGSEKNLKTSSFYEAGVPSNFIQDGDTVVRLNVIDGHLQSNGFETGVEGWQLNSNGNLEANDGNFRGSLNVADNWHVDTDGNMWWGDFATYALATIKISKAGAAFLSGATISGDITAGAGSDIPFDKISAATNTKDLKVGGSNVQIRGSKPDIMINDGSNDRIHLGYMLNGY